MKINIDRDSAVPIHRQVRDAIEQAVFLGDLPVGASLPSVRDLAGMAGIAQMTVCKVYSELKAAGVIETRAGSRTYVADGPLTQLATAGVLRGLQAEADTLIDAAYNLGLPAEVLTALIAARIAARQHRGPRKRVVMVGLFAEATGRYAASIAAQIGALAKVQAVTVDQLTADPALRQDIETADIVLTFATLAAQLTKLIPAARLVSIRFIPSEDTRMALALIDPMARMAVVSRFEGFLPVLTLGARRFAAHVQDVVALTLEDPGLAHHLANRDVVLFSTGADAAMDVARPGAMRIEYRHIPDPGDIERLVMPVVSPLVMPAASGRKEAS